MTPEQSGANPAIFEKLAGLDESIKRMDEAVAQGRMPSQRLDAIEPQIAELHHKLDQLLSELSSIRKELRWRSWIQS